MICDLVADTSLPWLIFDDFNDFVSNDEKIGWVNHPSWLLRGFHETILECNLHSLPMEGYQFTWARRLGECDGVEGKLDRDLATLEWIDLFLNFRLLSGLSSKFYHTPIILNLDGIHRRGFKMHFCFENA